jgi:hypothetical protein
MGRCKDARQVKDAEEQIGDLKSKVGATKKFTLPGVVRGMVCVAVSSKL